VWVDLVQVGESLRVGVDREVKPTEVRVDVIGIGHMRLA
jgi:hypothetical protein